MTYYIEFISVANEAMERIMNRIITITAVEMRKGIEQFLGC